MAQYEALVPMTLLYSDVEIGDVYIWDIPIEPQGALRVGGLEEDLTDMYIHVDLTPAQVAILESLNITVTEL